MEVLFLGDEKYIKRRELQYFCWEIHVSTFLRIKITNIIKLLINNLVPQIVHSFSALINQLFYNELFNRGRSCKYSLVKEFII